MIVHITQEIVLLDLFITLSRAYRKRLMKERGERRDAEDAESGQELCSNRRSL